MITIFSILIVAYLLYKNITLIEDKINYDVHVKMMGENYHRNGCKIVNYMNFMDEWNKCKSFMVPHLEYKNSFVHENRYKDIIAYDEDYYYHASIIRFNGTGMILNNMWSYRKVRKFMKKEYKNSIKYHNWK